METADHWEHFNGSELHPVPADPNNPMEAEKQEMKHWDRQDKIAQNLLNKLSRLGTHYLSRSSEGLDDGLELEVIDQEEEVGNGEASKAEDDGSEVG
jgi:hypothetical protein